MDLYLVETLIGYEMLVAEKYKRVIVQGISIFFILLFTYAAVNKFQQFEQFQVQLEQFPFIGGFAEWIAWVVLGVQIIIAFSLSFEVSRMLGLYSTLLLILIFTLYILAVLNFAESVPCSCGGVIASFSWTEHLLFNIGCLLLALLGIALSLYSKSDINPSLLDKIKIKP